MIAKELLDALNNVQNKTDLDPTTVWALSEYLQAAWKDNLDQVIRPFNVGKALGDFFVDLSQHRLPEKISQHTPGTEALLMRTFGADEGSLFQFWTKCAGIWKVALETYPADAKGMQGYFDLLLQSSLQEKRPGPPAVSAEKSIKPSIETSKPVPVKPILKTGPENIPIPAVHTEVHETSVQSYQPKPEPEFHSLPKNAYLVLQGTRVIPLNQSLIKIGRQLDNHIILEDPRVSRSHAQLRLINDHFVIFDLNSTGGTFINGLRTSQSVLYPGDVVSLAGVKFIYAQEMPAKPGDLKIIELGSPFAADRPTAVLHREEIKAAKEAAGRDRPELPDTAPLEK